MNKMQEQVAEFHRAMNVPIATSLRLERPLLRADLILEEAVETALALVYSHMTATDAMYYVRWRLDMLLGEWSPKVGFSPFAETVDGLCDTIYVCLGTALEMGIDIEPFFNEVHRSNMEKVGGPVREDGKRLKPDGWQPPRIEEMLEELKANGR